jgi:hypothetical protein
METPWFCSGRLSRAVPMSLCRGPRGERVSVGLVIAGYQQPLISLIRTAQAIFGVALTSRRTAYCVHTLKSSPQTLAFARIMLSTAWIG